MYYLEDGMITYLRQAHRQNNWDITCTTCDTTHSFYYTHSEYDPYKRISGRKTKKIDQERRLTRNNENEI